jgi:hypothetical protein
MVDTTARVFPLCAASDGIRFERLKARKEASMAKQPLEKNERLKRRFFDYRKYAR